MSLSLLLLRIHTPLQSAGDLKRFKWVRLRFLSR
jgi:hypothetical protein